MLDNAGWSISKELRIPPNLVLLNTPAYTPELAPVEAGAGSGRQPLFRRSAAST